MNNHKKLIYLYRRKYNGHFKINSSYFDDFKFKRKKLDCHFPLTQKNFSQIFEK